MEDYCISCGQIVPEGRQICWICEQKISGSPRIHANRKGIHRGKNTKLLRFHFPKKKES